MTEQNSFASNLEFQVYSWQSLLIDWSSAVNSEGQRQSKVPSLVQISTEDQGYSLLLLFFFQTLNLYALIFKQLLLAHKHFDMFLRHQTANAPFPPQIYIKTSHLKTIITNV